MPFSHLIIFFWHYLIPSPHTNFLGCLKNGIFIWFFENQNPNVVFGCQPLRELISYLHCENSAVHFIRCHTGFVHIYSPKYQSTCHANTCFYSLAPSVNTSLLTLKLWLNISDSTSGIPLLWSPAFPVTHSTCSHRRAIKTLHSQFLVVTCEYHEMGVSLPKMTQWV